MSEHERWVVYPLLFLALGVGLRDKLTRTITADRIECRTLAFTQRDDKPRMTLTTEEYLAEDQATRTEKADVPSGLALFDAGLRRIASIGEVLRCRALAVEKVAECNAVAVRGPASCRTLIVGETVEKPLVVVGHEKFQRAEKPAHFGVITTFSSDGRPLAQLGPVSRCKALVVDDEQGQPLVTVGPQNYLRGGKPDHAGAIKTFDSKGAAQAQLGPVLLCQEMHIVGKGELSRRLISLGSVATTGPGDEPGWAGRITLQGTDGRPVLALGTDEPGAAGIVTTQLADGRAQAVLRATQEGALLTLADPDRQLTLAMGHFPSESGIVAADAQGKVLPWLPLLKRTPAPGKPAVGKPPEPPGD